MSKSIIIRRNDGTAFSQAVDKLRTSSGTGGDIMWVPEDETRCTSLAVTANGTYDAEDAGKYGYDYVTVSVLGNSVTGRDPATGKTVNVSKDPTTGNLVETAVPVSIRITTPPAKTEYVAGEAISMTGAVVKAYDSDGDVLMTVPLNEIHINPTEAPEASSETKIAYDASMLSTEYRINPLVFVKLGYGTEVGTPATITVSWPRPQDGAVLETSFEISVTGGVTS